MKKVLAVLLVITLLLSTAPMAFAITVPAFTYETSEVAKDGTFKVTVIAPANISKLTGVVLYFAFDPMVLQVVSGAPCGWKDADNNFYENFAGTDSFWVNDLRPNGSEYSFAFASMDGVDKASAKEMVEITFKVIDPTATSTTVNMYLDEFKTKDGDDTNDIKSSTFVFSDTVTLTPSSTDPSDKPSSTVTTEPTASDIEGLIQIIKDMLKGNGASFSDFTDAINNILANFELTDFIEQLVGGMDIGEEFQKFLEGLGIDMGGFEDILNKIIDFFKGLFGGNDPTKQTTQNATLPTQDASGDNDTTKKGSSSGSEGTGDAGIALAVTVCVAAAAAFVMTRKKKEFVEE